MYRERSHVCFRRHWLALPAHSICLYLAVSRCAISEWRIFILIIRRPTRLTFYSITKILYLLENHLMTVKIVYDTARWQAVIEVTAHCPNPSECAARPHRTWVRVTYECFGQRCITTTRRQFKPRYHPQRARQLQLLSINCVQLSLCMGAGVAARSVWCGARLRMSMRHADQACPR